MKKCELKARLEAGETLNGLLTFGPGQECEIFKADKFITGDEVIYIPDTWLNGINITKPISNLEELDEVLSNCYTGDDFVAECGGDVKKAEALFWFCDWQHPSSALDDGAINDDEEEK